jgi:MOSC domain-containing protein YiiM
MRSRVVSVNAGRPREVQYQGRTVRTRIFKDPVTGWISVSVAGLAGDGQADLVVHGPMPLSKTLCPAMVDLLGS